MTKEEVIKEAYGERWPLIKDYVDKNGWCIKRKRIGFEKLKNKIELQYSQHDNAYAFRPKSLKGIENNNGWIKINSEDDLPEHGYYEVVKRRNGEISRATLDNEFNRQSLFKHYSHYQKIKELPKPIY